MHDWLKWDRIWRVRPTARDRGTRRRDPLSVGVAFLVNIGYGGAISGLGATLVGSALIGAAVFGASLLVSAFTPKPKVPEAQERQSTVRQSVGPRWRFYGRNKVGGTLWFFESRDGYLYSGITLNEGEISAIQEIWLNDKRQYIDDDGYVTGKDYDEGEDENGRVARLEFRMGSANQSAYPSLVSAFPGDWTDEHRLRGVATCLARFQEVDGSELSKIYPQGNPAVRIVMDASIVKSVRTGERVYSDNPADCIYDYLTGKDGAGFPYGAGYRESQIDLLSFQAFADLCDERVPLKGGGTDRRYRMCSGFALNEEMRTVLTRMCQACDAVLYVNADGKMAIRGGKWVEPQLTLDSSLGHIISGEFRQGQSALAAFNELNITYVDPSQDYLDTEGERWIDSANVALRGKVLSSQLNLPMVPYHGQARRLAKIHTAKSNPLWIGTLVTNFYGFNALGEETIRVKFDPLGIDTTFLVQSVKILDDLTGVQIEVTSLGSGTYGWDAQLEEGDGPGVVADTAEPISLEPPADFHVSAAQLVVDGTAVGTYLAATWTEPSRTALSQEVEYRLSGDPAWSQMTVADESQGFAQSTNVTAGGTYEVRSVTRSPGGVYSDYTDVKIVVASPDTVAPTAPTNLSAKGGAGRVTFSGRHSVSTNSVGVRVLRSATDDPAAATLFRAQYGSPGTPFSLTGNVTTGTAYYWLVAFNGGGTPSEPVALGALTVS